MWLKVAEGGWDVCREIRPVEQGEEAQFTLKIGKKGVKHTGSVLPASLILSTYLASEESEVNQLSLFTNNSFKSEKTLRRNTVAWTASSAHGKGQQKGRHCRKEKLEEVEDSEDELPSFAHGWT